MHQLKTLLADIETWKARIEPESLLYASSLCDVTSDCPSCPIGHSNGTALCKKTPYMELLKDTNIRTRLSEAAVEMVDFLSRMIPENLVFKLTLAQHTLILTILSVWKLRAQGTHPTSDSSFCNHYPSCEQCPMSSLTTHGCNSDFTALYQAWESTDGDTKKEQQSAEAMAEYLQNFLQREETLYRTQALGVRTQ